MRIMKQNGTKSKQLMNLVIQVIGSALLSFLQLFHKFKIMSKNVLKPCYFKTRFSFLLTLLGR